MKEKIYSMYGKAIDENGQVHMVTVVGKYVQTRVNVEKEIESLVLINDKPRTGKTMVSFKQPLRTLTMAYSICHPNDTFDKDKGIELALKRIERGDYIGELNSQNITMLNQDQCNIILFGELQYITKNIEKYLPQPCEDYDENDETCQNCRLAPHNFEVNQDKENSEDTEIELEILEDVLPKAPSFDELEDLEVGKG